jgi:predicted amidophosphoribosyltransferase
MRCSHCGQDLPKGTERCTRCGADLSPATRIRQLLVSVVFAVLAIALVALLTHVVLHWHDMQIFVKRG